MPTNLDALIRYHTIDRCLQNRYRKWIWENLSDECLKAISETRNIDSKSSISKRTIENDIRIMRSDILGYNAPIVRKNGFFFYSDPDYSVKNLSLSKKDIENLSFAIKMLNQYKGLKILQDIEGIFNKLESNVYLKTKKETQNIVEFETLLPAKGIEHINFFLDCIIENWVVELIYQRFESKESKQHIFHPYFLKEFRNRWYVIGLTEKRNTINTFALDRIVDLKLSDKPYKTNELLNPQTFFNHTIGVSYAENTSDIVILKFPSQQADYIKTQPLHPTQQIISDNPTGLTISLNLVLNYELESLLLSYGNNVEVVKPVILRKRMIERITEVSKIYF